MTERHLVTSDGELIDQKGGEKFGEKIPPHLHIGEARGPEEGGPVRTRNNPSPPPIRSRFNRIPPPSKLILKNELC